MAQNYPYYIAVTYDAGILRKIKFGVQNGKKFKTWSDCAASIKRRYSKYQSKIVDICQGDEWTSVASPIKLID